ncbi:ArnT family glycosyltransferase [Mangrovibacterium lignilyticum]|uniref:ArnT family glycosyltransferase n=1 Tax=Mangrovibacterium lignilyticum TaxID=2668052 RepID=UPI0013D8A1D6|nr:glycosyltransferase family 39 protein [Mangrovibacterium lignilyticum]
MKLGTHNSRQLLLTGFAVLLTVLAYYFGLFIDLTGDAGKYGAIARHVFESGDLINLKIHGEAYDQKPPLLFWLAALGFKLGGLQNWTYKLFPVIYSIAGIYFTAKLGETLYNKHTGKLAVVFLGTSEIYFLFTMDVHTDLILQANVTLAIWQLANYLKTRKALNFIWAFVAIGLAMTSKGPIGAAIPAFALGTHLILKKDFKQLFHQKWLLGIAIAFLIATPAFLGLVNQFGLKGLKFFFITNNLGRITGEYAGNNTDPFFYLHSLLYLFIPWSTLLIFAIFREFRQIKQEGTNKSEYLTFGGIWIFFIIASISKGKAPHYIFMLIPMFAVICSKWVNILIENKNGKALKIVLYTQNTLYTLLLIFSLITATYLFPPKKLILVVPLIVALAGYILTLKSNFSYKYKLILPGVLLISSLNIYINANVLPKAFSYQASTRAAILYDVNAEEGEKLYNYLYRQYELFFYPKTETIQLYSMERLKENPPAHNFWIFTNQVGLDSIQNNAQISIIENHPLKNRGMNSAGLQFILPDTRELSLNTMYLIKAYRK